MCVTHNMVKIVRTVHVAHRNGHLLGGLLHYVNAASNHTAKGYRRGARGKELYGMAIHRTGVYHARFAAYVVRDVQGSHRAWRTNQRMDPYTRAPHYHNAAAQTDCFELAFDGTARRWDGSLAIHVAIYGRGRPDQPWMAFRVPPYVVERLTGDDIRPKTVLLTGDKIYVRYERDVPDREPVSWAGVDMNAKNNTYAYANGMVSVVWNDYAKQYNAACGKILRVKRRGDKRIMAKYEKEAWGKYKNRAGDYIGREARALAAAGCGVGYETLSIHRLYTKNGTMSPFMRGRQKTTLNTGQRRRAIVNALDSEGLPHRGVDPAGTSADCLGCGKRLKRAVAQEVGVRNLWCQPCCSIRERDGNASANILLRTITAIVTECMGRDDQGRGVTLPDVLGMLREAVADRRLTTRQRSTLSDILRLLEGRSAGAEWRPPGAHKPGRRNPAGGELVGGPGVDGAGRNGPGPPNAAKLCNYA